MHEGPRPVRCGGHRVPLGLRRLSLEVSGGGFYLRRQVIVLPVRQSYACHVGGRAADKGARETGGAQIVRGPGHDEGLHGVVKTDRVQRHAVGGGRGLQQLVHQGPPLRLGRVHLVNGEGDDSRHDSEEAGKSQRDSGHKAPTTQQT